MARQGKDDFGLHEEIQLVYFELDERIDQAIAREKQLKGWIRANKDALIAKMNPEWKDLSTEWDVLSS